VAKDTHRAATTEQTQLEPPEQVTLAVAELAGAAREGLLALAVGTRRQASARARSVSTPGTDRRRPLGPGLDPAGGLRSTAAWRPARSATPSREQAACFPLVRPASCRQGGGPIGCRVCLPTFGGRRWPPPPRPQRGRH
jgi:hypothetical protein